MSQSRWNPHQKRYARFNLSFAFIDGFGKDYKMILCTMIEQWNDEGLDDLISIKQGQNIATAKSKAEQREIIYCKWKLQWKKWLTPTNTDLFWGTKELTKWAHLYVKFVSNNCRYLIVKLAWVLVEICKPTVMPFPLQSL